MKISIFILFCLCSCPCRAQGIQVFFSPNGGCTQAVIDHIDQASQSIDIAMYYLSSAPIAKSLVAAQDRGVSVRIVLDQGQEIESSAKSGFLVTHGIELRYHLGFGLMHNKFTVIDHRVLITGSFNWTSTAEERNEENMLIISDPATVTAYANRFDYLWSTSRMDERQARGLASIPAWFCSSLHLFCN